MSPPCVQGGDFGIYTKPELGEDSIKDNMEKGARNIYLPCGEILLMAEDIQ